MISRVYNLEQTVNFNIWVVSNSEFLSVIKSRRLNWIGHLVRMEIGRNVFIIFTDKPTGKRPLGSLSCRWDDNIIMDIKEIGINTRNWIASTQARY